MLSEPVTGFRDQCRVELKLVLTSSNTKYNSSIYFCGLLAILAKYNNRNRIQTKCAERTISSKKDPISDSYEADSQIICSYQEYEILLNGCWD